MSANYIIKFKLFVFLRKTAIFKDYISKKEIGEIINEIINYGKNIGNQRLCY